VAAVALPPPQLAPSAPASFPELLPAPVPGARLPLGSGVDDAGLTPDARAARAMRERRAVVVKRFADAGVAFPPKELLFRGFKREHDLEVWASSERGEPMTKIATYEICGLSGDLGPKRSEGDAQVPEGFYRIAYLWPNSNFHLEMNVNYPNLSDRILADGRPAGGDIMIHGACASAGCLAMTDERVEELWVMASSAQVGEEKVLVHLFPSRVMSDLYTDERYAQHRAFWKTLEPALDLFERTHRPPRVHVDWRGRYEVAAAR
jgi:murein L,D-transpeptidase YafK